jgi:integrase-like protein
VIQTARIATSSAEDNAPGQARSSPRTDHIYRLKPRPGKDPAVSPGNVRRQARAGQPHGDRKPLQRQDMTTFTQLTSALSHPPEPFTDQLRLAVAACLAHPHMLRHTYVTTMLDAGADLRDVQIAARHADPRTTMRYDNSRTNLDRHPNYILAAYMASGT